MNFKVKQHSWFHDLLVAVFFVLFWLFCLLFHKDNFGTLTLGHCEVM